MTQEVGAGSHQAAPGLGPAWADVLGTTATGGPAAGTAVGGVAPIRTDPAAGPGATRPARRRGERAQVVVTALLLLVLFAGDLLVALQLPVRSSTCSDRLCGPALAVAAGAIAAGVLAVTGWLVADRRRERGKGGALRWGSLAVAALPWLFVALRLQWW